MKSEAEDKYKLNSPEAVFCAIRACGRVDKGDRYEYKIIICINGEYDVVPYETKKKKKWGYRDRLKSVY